MNNPILGAVALTVRSPVGQRAMFARGGTNGRRILASNPHLQGDLAMRIFLGNDLVAQKPAVGRVENPDVLEYAWRRNLLRGDVVCNQNLGEVFLLEALNADATAGGALRNPRTPLEARRQALTPERLTRIVYEHHPSDHWDILSQEIALNNDWMYRDLWRWSEPARMAMLANPYILEETRMELLDSLDESEYGNSRIVAAHLAHMETGEIIDLDQGASDLYTLKERTPTGEEVARMGLGRASKFRSRGGNMARLFGSFGAGVFCAEKAWNQGWSHARVVTRSGSLLAPGLTWLLDVDAATVRYTPEMEERFGENEETWNMFIELLRRTSASGVDARRVVEATEKLLR